MKTSELLKIYSVKLKKGLGQNFLSDERIAKKIVKESGVGEGDTVVEIGAGAGTLTEELAKTGAKVIAYEIDRSLEKLLRDRLSVYSNVSLVFEDFLDADLSFLEDGFHYVANIPYNITGPIIEKILRVGRFSSAVLMLQREVAQRVVSEPGRRSFGYLSVLVQTFCSLEKLFDVSRSHFVPNPDVDSTVLRLVWKGMDLDFEDYRIFLAALFSKKRKNLRNNLKGLVGDPESILKKLDLDPNLRPEQLEVEKILEIYEEVRG